MSMHQGLDLSRFKKVASDKKTTTLRHAKGHEIKIAHSGLTPKMRAELDKLEMAEGGEIRYLNKGGDDDPSQTTGEAQALKDPTLPSDDLDPKSPEPATDPSLAEIEPGAPIGDISNAAPVDSPEPSPAALPAAPTETPPLTPAEEAQQMTMHDMAFQGDLAKGVITPKTYASLFANKSTLGKVGTLFGMLLSGAGSGLAHQSNAVLDMMNREIDRDLDAQKTGNANAQNWYRLSQQHELQAAQIPLLKAQAMATLGGAYEHATSADLTRAKIQALDDPTIDLRASNAARNRMILAFGQDMQGTVNKLPPGVTKANGQNALDTQVNPASEAVGADTTAKPAALFHAVKTLKGTTPPAKTPPETPSGPGSAINYKELNRMIKDSRNHSSLGMASKLTEADTSKLNDEAADIEANRVAAKMYNHAFTKLQNTFLKGALSEELYNSETATLGPEIARATAGRFNLTEANKQTSGMFPSWKDFISNAGQEKYNNAMEYFKGKEASTSTLNRFPGLKTPFPTFPSPFGDKKKASGLKEGTKGVDKNGRPTIVKGGKVVYQ